MTDGHPLVWLWLLLVGSTIALNTTNPLLLFILVLSLGTTGFLAAGPRRASLVTSLGAALGATAFWILLTLLVPRGTAADALLVLPSWSPGPGVTFGGPLDLSSVVTGLVGALQAAWSAICHTPVPEAMPWRHLQDSLATAIGIGHDTDTVAAIAGALLGARWGASAVPLQWAGRLHG